MSDIHGFPSWSGTYFPKGHDENRQSAIDFLQSKIDILECEVEDLKLIHGFLSANKEHIGVKLDSALWNLLTKIK